MTVDGVGLRIGGRSRDDARAGDRVLAAAGVDGLAHEWIAGRSVRRWIAQQHRPATVHGQLGWRLVLEHAAAEAGGRCQVLPRHSSDDGEREEGRSAIRTLLVEERVRYQIASPIWHGTRAEAVRVALRRIEQVEAEAPLLIEAAQVQVVIRRGESNPLHALGVFVERRQPALGALSAHAWQQAELGAF